LLRAQRYCRVRRLDPSSLRVVAPPPPPPPRLHRYGMTGGGGGGGVVLYRSAGLRPIPFARGRPDRRCGGDCVVGGARVARAVREESGGGNERARVAHTSARVSGRGPNECGAVKGRISPKTRRERGRARQPACPNRRRRGIFPTNSLFGEFTGKTHVRFGKSAKFFRGLSDYL